MEAIKQLQQKPALIQQQPPQTSANTILARLINLSVAAFGAGSSEKAGSVIVNRIHTLLQTDRAMIAPLKGKKRIFCVSGDLDICEGQDNPYSQAVDEIRKAFRESSELRVISKDTLPDDLNAPNARKVLEAVGGTNVLWIPLTMTGDEESGYGLWLERWNNKPWGKEEIKLLSHAAVFFGHALINPRKKRTEFKSKAKKMWKKLLSFPMFIFLICLIPIHARIAAPVQVVSDRPYYVFAPFDGIIESLEVQPGEHVEKGDLIFRYDTRVLEKQLEEARRGVAVARAELARLEGAAYADEDARAKIPVQKLEVERSQAEVEFLQRQLELSEVRSGADGVVVLDDPETLIGSPLGTGQLVLRVADPKRTKLKLMVPVADVGIFDEGNPVFVRLDVNPLKMYDAEVKRIGFDVVISDKQIPSVLVEAEWKEDSPATPGQAGTARIHGKKTALGLVWFRRPLSRWRNRLGHLGI